MVICLYCIGDRFTMIYGQEDDNANITEYLNSNLENDIKQNNLDKILDLIDEYVELKEAVIEE